MTPEQRLRKAFELTEFANDLFKKGLKLRYPNASEEDLQEIYLERIALWHNRNY